MELIEERLQKSALALRKSKALMESEDYAESIKNSYYCALHAIHSLSGRNNVKTESDIYSYVMVYEGCERLPKNTHRYLIDIYMVKNLNKKVSVVEVSECYNKAKSILMGCVKYLRNECLCTLDIESILHE